MKNKVFYLFITLLIATIGITGCDDKKHVDFPSEYVKFELKDQAKFYPGADSVFQFCYERGDGRFYYDFAKNFTSSDDEFYTFTVSGLMDYLECPKNEISPSTPFHIMISRKLESGQFVDYIHYAKGSDIDLIQNFTENKLELLGKFSGQFYQMWEVRPEGPFNFPEGYPMDSLFIEHGEFRFKLNSN